MDAAGGITGDLPGLARKENRRHGESKNNKICPFSQMSIVCPVNYHPPWRHEGQGESVAVFAGKRRRTQERVCKYSAHVLLKNVLFLKNNSRDG